ncbi:MAG: hypothetical protein M1834_009088 [Cirrosporium novae-zelandiae]|nr:MAG: hypothetical protein M1834_009088 [Cirrosporium novae-zelandiae]
MADMDIDPTNQEEEEEEDDEVQLDPGDAEEVIELQNDSAAHFDGHSDSILCIAQHPIHSSIVATGGVDDLAYIFDSTPAEKPVLPSSWGSNPIAADNAERESLKPLVKLEGHKDSVSAITFTLPNGEFLVTTGLDGQIRVYQDKSPELTGTQYIFLASAQETEDINWLTPCPNPTYPNTFALGAKDGSVWIYTINPSDPTTPLTIAQAFYLHTGESTAGAWNPTGDLLASVSDDSALLVFDAFGLYSAAGLANPVGSQTVVALNAQDQRFAVEGGLYCVAIAPGGAFVAVGGANGTVKIIGLPRLPDTTTTPSSSKSKSKSKARATANTSTAGQAGQILASLSAQGNSPDDSIETLSFSSPQFNLLAAGCVDGSVAVFDTQHAFRLRRMISDAHEGYAVVKVEFVRDSSVLTSVGYDGVVRRWETRGGMMGASGSGSGSASGSGAGGLMGEWKGHPPVDEEGQGGGILGFVQGGGERIVTAGNEGVGLIFEAGKRS